MRQLANLLRLHHDGVSAREIGQTSGRGAQHDPGQSETGFGGWFKSAIAGSTSRTTLWKRQLLAAARTAPGRAAGRAGLADFGSRT